MTADVVYTQVFCAEVVVIAIFVFNTAPGSGDGFTRSEDACVVGTWISVFTISRVLTATLNGDVETGSRVGTGFRSTRISVCAVGIFRAFTAWCRCVDTIPTKAGVDGAFIFIIAFGRCLATTHNLCVATGMRDALVSSTGKAIVTI